MRIERFYAVAVPDHYGEPQQHGARIHHTIDDAAQDHDRRTAAGIEARVYLMQAVPDSALYDWGVATDRHPQPAEYVNETAARNSVGPGGRLYRRRCGTTAWEQVPA